MQLIQAQHLGLMIDEYTDVSCNKHLAFVSKYILDGSSKIAFLQDIQLSMGQLSIFTLK